MNVALAFLLVCCALNEALNFQVPLNRHDTKRKMLIREKKWTELQLLNHQILSARQNSRLDATNQTLYNFLDEEFNMIMMIGTPPQKFVVLPDTTGNNLWITDQSCNGSYIDCPDYCYASDDWCQRYCDTKCCKRQFAVLSADPCLNKTKYQSDKSSTYQLDGRPFHLNYGIGNVSGVLGIDTVTLGDSSHSISILQTTFGQANKLSVHFAPVPIDGVFGLGFQKAAVDSVETPLERAIQLRLFDEPVFSVFVQAGQPHTNSLGSDLPPSGGLITFGAKDTQNCKPFKSYIPLISDSAWQFDVDAVGPNRELRSGSYKTLVSIGSSMIIGPTDTLIDLVDATNAQYNFQLGLYTVNCDIQFTWTIKINGIEYKVDGKNLLWPLDDNECILTYNGWDESTPDGVNLFLGLPVVHQFCILFDIGQKRVSFSEHRF